MKTIFLLLLHILAINSQSRQIGKFNEVYAWKQITYDINGQTLTQDRFSSEGLFGQYDRSKRQADFDAIYFNDNMNQERDWNNKRYPTGTFEEMNTQTEPPNYIFDSSHMMRRTTSRPMTDNSSSFFIQYNNVPMGAEKYGHRLFITIPRRRYGIPSTLNYINLNERTRSPHLKPYPSLNNKLISVYRTRADSCERLWMVDTGLLEIPNSPQQVQKPSIVVFDLRTDRQIMKYELKNTDIPANNTPTGLASITIDTSEGCGNAFAYIPDLTTNGIIVFSLRERDSWRITHNYLHFNPTASNLNIAGQRFQWNDGVFSITLGPRGRCRPAYFHPMVSTQEFSVSTCVLNNKTADRGDNFWEKFNIVGDRGSNSQSTMHDYHEHTNVIFFADIGRDGVSCWNTALSLTPQNVELLARDSKRMSYPADLHVTDNEVWIITNTLPRFGYSQLDTNEYNFYVYSANIHDIISGTRCDGNII